jgi:hypothetical protein
MTTGSPAHTVGPTSTSGTHRLRRGRGRRWAGVVAAATAAMLGGTLMVAPAASAATLTATTSSKVTGTNTVEAMATISSSPSTNATLAGICARDSTGKNFDFPLRAATLTTAGTTLNVTRDLPVGNYTYWACAKIDGKWNDIGAKRPIVVTGVAPAPPVPEVQADPAVAPGGKAMPVGDLPGWKQVFADDFTTPLARGSFPGAYSNKWMSYNGFTDTSGQGDYNQKIISVQNGAMDLYLHSANGRAQGAAPIPLVNGRWGGQTYGKFSIRFKSDALPGFGTGWLLWPDSGNWNDGEVDFPESGLDTTIWGYNHCPGNPTKNCTWLNSGVTYTDWHTATVEWTPSRVTFLLDGNVVGQDTAAVPNKPLHWVLQTATTGSKPAATTAGHLLIDWATIYTYNP